jgi:hypothetical protein
MKALKEWRLACERVRVRWAAATLLLAPLAWTTPVQDGRENFLPNAAQPPTPAEQAQIIENARAIAREYTESLPNFIATQTTRRQQRGKGAKTWKPQDTLVLDVAFIEGEEQYTLLTINGKPTKKTKDETGGMNVSGEFGSALRKLFNPKAEAKFKWEGQSGLAGRPVHVFAYHIARDHSEYGMRMDSDGKEYKGTVAYSGVVYVDRETYQVVALTSTAEGIPPEWPAKAVSDRIDYGFIQIDGRQVLLPLHAETNIVWTNETTFRNVTDFSNYHEFTTGVTITPVTPPQ